MLGDTVARAFVTHWISRFGIPSKVTTDRGRQFESMLWKELMQVLGSTRIRTTAYHPRANGLVERFHQQLKSSLRTDPSANWVDLLPLILLGVCTALKEDIGACTGELMYGMTLRIPGAFFASLTNTSITGDPANYVVKLKDIFPRPQSKFASFTQPESVQCLSIKISRHQVIFFYAMMLYASLCNHLTMGHIRFSSALTSISPLQLKERMKLFPLID